MALSFLYIYIILIHLYFVCFFFFVKACLTSNLYLLCLVFFTLLIVKLWKTWLIDLRLTPQLHTTLIYTCYCYFCLLLSIIIAPPLINTNICLKIFWIKIFIQKFLWIQRRRQPKQNLKFFKFNFWIKLTRLQLFTSGFVANFVSSIISHNLYFSVDEVSWPRIYNFFFSWF